jgi:hypothetical protein
MKQVTRLSLVALTAAALAGCGRDSGIGGTSGDATAATLQANAQFAQTLQLDDKQAFEDAKRGFIARPEGKIVGADGNMLIDFDAFKFVEGPAPSTVNPSLWRPCGRAVAACDRGAAARFGPKPAAQPQAARAYRPRAVPRTALRPRLLRRRGRLA